MGSRNTTVEKRQRVKFILVIAALEHPFDPIPSQRELARMVGGNRPTLFDDELSEFYEKMSKIMEVLQFSDSQNRIEIHKNVAI